MDKGSDADRRLAEAELRSRVAAFQSGLSRVQTEMVRLESLAHQVRGLMGVLPLELERLAEEGAALVAELGKGTG